MYVIICNYRDGADPLPMMSGEEETEMMQFDLISEVRQFCDEHLLCRNWSNIIVNLEIGTSELYIPEDK